MGHVQGGARKLQPQVHRGTRQCTCGLCIPRRFGRPTNSYPVRLGVLAGRTGLAYDVFGSGETSIRGSIGIFDSSVLSRSLNNTSANAPYGYSISIASPTGGLSNPYSDNGGSPFPFAPPTASQYSSYTFKSPLGVVLDFAPNFRNARVDQWNLSMQQELPVNTVLTVAGARCSDQAGSVFRFSYLCRP